MTTFQFPSAEFPALPTIALESPDGWEPMDVGTALLAIGRTVPAGLFRPNVCVTMERFSGVLDIAGPSDAVIAKFASLDEFAEVGRELLTVSGFDAFRMEGGFHSTEAGTIFQAVYLICVVHGGFTDIVQAVASCTASETDTMIPEIRSILTSIQVSRGGLDTH